MVELIFIIAIIAYIVKGAKKAEENQRRYEKANANNNPWEGAYKPPKQATRVQTARAQVQQQTAQAVQEQIAKTKQRIMQSRGMTSSVANTEENVHFQQANMHRQQENREAMQQVHASRMENRNTSILQRAMANADEDKVDITLETMEAEHNHSERVSAAVHHHPEDTIPESMLGNIEDLMIKGYDGNLCFERDFVGEGLDMISRFTVPSDIPDFSSDDVA